MGEVISTYVLVHVLKLDCKVCTARAREAAVPEDPLFGIRLFVCAKNWVLRYNRSLNELEGPCSEWYIDI